MKSTRALLVSLLAGVFAVALVHLYVSKKELDLRQSAEPRAVYVATEDIPEMVRIDAKMVERVEIPALYVQPQATTELDEIVDSVARVPIFKGMQVSRNLLVSKLETGLAMRVDPLRRALSVAVSDVTGVAGLIQPGNRVDIYATFKLQKGNDETVESHLMLSDIQVLAVERRTGGVWPEEVMSRELHRQKEQSGELDKRAERDEYPRNVTLSVTSQEAIRLITAQEAGFLTLVLRSQFEEALDESLEKETIQPLSIQDIIGGEEKTVPQHVPRYEQIRGSEITY